MDGLLIDTEPVWRAAESAVFAGLGIPLSESDLLDSTGQPIEELIPIWRRRALDAVCDRLGLDGIEVRCSAMDEARGKPAPDVYLTAARRLGVAAARCLALEDSPNGVASAKAAGMRCVAVPDPLLADNP